MGVQAGDTGKNIFQVIGIDEIHFLDGVEFQLRSGKDFQGLKDVGIGPVQGNPDLVDTQEWPNPWSFQ